MFNNNETYLVFIISTCILYELVHCQIKLPVIERYSADTCDVSTVNSGKPNSQTILTPKCFPWNTFGASGYYECNSNNRVVQKVFTDSNCTIPWTTYTGETQTQCHSFSSSFIDGDYVLYKCKNVTEMQKTFEGFNYIEIDEYRTYKLKNCNESNFFGRSFIRTDCLLQDTNPHSLSFKYRMQIDDGIYRDHGFQDRQCTGEPQIKKKISSNVCKPYPYDATDYNGVTTFTISKILSSSPKPSPYKSPQNSVIPNTSPFNSSQFNGTFTNDSNYLLDTFQYMIIFSSVAVVILEIFSAFDRL